MTGRRVLVALALVTAATVTVAGQTRAQQPPVPLPGETIGQYRARLRGLMAEEKAQTEDRKREAVQTEVAETRDEVAAQPASATPPDGFGDRLAGTITDFLPLFQFAVDSVAPSDDGQAVVVAFNPIRTSAWGAIKLTATAAKPEPSERLLGELPEAVRSAEKETIAKGLSDLDDVTWTATYGYQTEDLDTTKRTRFGREPELYRPVVRQLVGAFAEVLQAEALQQGGPALELGRYEAWLREAFGQQPDGLTFHDIEHGLGSPEIRAKIASGELDPFDFQGFLRALEAKAAAEAQLNRLYGTFHLDRLATLIHNQPQLVFSASYRDRDRLVGQDSLFATVRLELGGRNLNSVLREYVRQAGTEDLKAQPAQLAAAYRTVAGELETPEPPGAWRGTVAVTYKRLEDDVLDYEYDGGRIELELPEVEEWCGKAQLSRMLGSQARTIDGETVLPRVDLSLEVFEVSGDPMRQDRRVAKLSYDLPLAKGVTLPVTLVYANKAEFRGDPDEQLSAHVGLSFKLDKLTKGLANPKAP